MMILIELSAIRHVPFHMGHFCIFSKIVISLYDIRADNFKAIYKNQKEKISINTHLKCKLSMKETWSSGCQSSE